MQRILVLLLAVTCLNGCVVYANIPGQAGDTAINSPNARDVRNAMAAGVRTLVDDRPIAGEFAVVLPEGSEPDTYDQVVARVGEQARPGDLPEYDSLPRLDIRQVRIRPTPVTAQVDVIRPSSGWDMASPPQLVTVYLRWDLFTGWSKDRAIRVWQLSVEDALNIAAGQTPEP